MIKPLRLVFLGSDAIALPLLDWIWAYQDQGKTGGFRLVALYTQPDRAAGRGQVIRPNAIKAWGVARGLPVLQPDKLGPEEQRELAGLDADAALVMAYGHILREDFIATPRLGTLNLHASLLPRYRGASPIQTAIAEGERETGVTLMRIVRRLDAGPVADAERVGMDRLDTAAAIEAKLAHACLPLLARALPRLANGVLTFADQDEAAATYCRKLGKADGVVDFRMPAGVIAARINGLFPWPSCKVTLAGQTLTLGLADETLAPVDAAGAVARPGVVVGQDAEGLLVGTGTGLLRLRRLQRAGGRMLPAVEFLRGFPIPAGSEFPSEPMPALVTTR